MDKTFAVAGISTHEGATKLRFANDLTRVKVLEKNGHKHVRLIELPRAMSKAKAVAHLAAHADYQDKAAQAVIGAYINEETGPATAKGAKPAKAVKAPKTSTPVDANLATLKAVHAKHQDAKVEDAETEAAETGGVAELDPTIDLEIPAFLRREPKPEVEG
jgi:hypothetical protein